MVVSLATGCSGDSVRDDATVAESNAENDGPKSLSSDAAAALVTCRQNIDVLGELEPDARVAHAVGSCRGIWLEEECSVAFERALELDSYRRAGLIMRACRDAYCPDLSNDLALCQASLTDPVSLLEPLDDPAATDPLEAWAAFNSEIFVRDYSANPEEQLLSGFPSMLLQLVIVAPSSQAPGTGEFGGSQPEEP
jgi:hypothetical protein